MCSRIVFFYVLLQKLYIMQSSFLFITIYCSFRCAWMRIGLRRCAKTNHIFFTLCKCIQRCMCLKGIGCVVDWWTIDWMHTYSLSFTHDGNQVKTDVCVSKERQRAKMQEIIFCNLCKVIIYESAHVPIFFCSSS